MRFEIRPGVRRLLRFPAWTRRAMASDADDELDALIACRIEHLIERGLSASEARVEAMRRLGAPLDQVRRQLHSRANRRERRMRIVESFESVMEDARYAARGLARRPAFTALALATIAIGVGATSAIFSAVNALILRPLPYARPAELMKVSLVLPAETGHPTLNPGFAYPTYRAIRDAQRSFSELAAYSPDEFVLTTGDVERVRGEYVAASYLRTLGLVPERGRDFDRAPEGRADAPREAIISDALWRRRFGADPSAVGRVIDIDRAPWTIIGVAPRGFRGLSGRADVFLPVATVAGALQRPGTSLLSIVARRAPSVTNERAQSEMAALGEPAANAFPNFMGKARWQVRASPLDALRIDPRVRRSLLILFGATWLVLAIACVNVASLLLGRASTRQREIAVRAALGAGRARLVRLLLAESLILALLGGIASIGVAWYGAHLIALADPAALFRGDRSAPTIEAVAFSSIALDWRVLGFALGASIGVGLLVGSASALSATSASLSKPLMSERNAAGSGMGRRALVISQIALALVLLVGSGLMVRSLGKLLSVDVGFDTSDLLSFTIDHPTGTAAGDSISNFYSDILDRVRAVPGVSDAALAYCPPFAPACVRLRFGRADAPGIPGAMQRYTGMDVVTPNWFSLMRVPLIRGRPFLPTDRRGRTNVVLINQTAARTFFPGVDPIGKRVSLGAVLKDAEVIGIVGDVRQLPDSEPGPTAYVTNAQYTPRTALVVVRSMRDPAMLGEELRHAVHDVAPNVPVDDLHTMRQRQGAATAQERFRAVLLTAFALTALVLAAIGIYGVLSFGVTTRTREIGIRIALGAERTRVQRLVIREGLALLSAGIAVGLCGALMATRVLRTFLFGLTPTDPVTYVAIVVVLGVTAVLASWIPGWRASRIDPAIALRAE